ncbi:hypothetical protein FALBO_9781 [Fusarium albosuccineum]|uniref:Uncharacterized protein n=1 Tax=Fusarium albosuccineum TaxID=1237068 RepID=A0A8H4L866_9HYPO|nr:hypothetical protein FALBO_9781 [Fusarium albosuccineum]
MSSLKPTYIPSPNWDIPADSDILVLGRMIKDPKNPESQVPGSSPDPIPPPKIYEGEKTDWQTNIERARAGTIGIWAKCLQVLGGGLSFSQLKSAMEDHKFDSLETKYFVPGDDYLTRAVQDLGVQAYFEVTKWRKPVYLITGIKIAKGASVATQSSTETSVQVELKADATTFSAPVEVGPEASWASKDSRGTAYVGSTDYVFAYQLMRMKPKKRGQAILNESFVEGAAFGNDSEEQEDVLGLREAYDVAEEVTLGFSDTWEQIGVSN